MSGTSLESISQDMLELIPETFRLYPLPENHDVTPDKWAGALRENPQYIDGTYRAMALAMAEDRSISEKMSEPYQRLAGTVIRIMFTDEELISIHNNAA